MLDVVADLDKIWYTGGRHYTYIDRETFESYFPFLDKYTLDDLKVDEEYRIVRFARRQEDGAIVYMTIDMKVLDRNETEMLFSHAHGAKWMHIGEQYKESWFFIKKADINN